MAEHAAIVEIKTKSIEQTLLPLVNQISILVNHKERPVKNGRIAEALRRIGKEVQLAVDRFVIVGEDLAENYAEIGNEMLTACQEARDAGHAICLVTSESYGSMSGLEKSLSTLTRERHEVLRSARFLLQSVTKVLLLADKVLVVQILEAKDRVWNTLHTMSATGSFSDFVKVFSQYGADMVQLARLSGERLQDLKDERRRAQLGASRNTLEKTTMLLLTSSKAFLRHPNCNEARMNRDIVFSTINNALNLLTYAVTDGEMAYHIPGLHSFDPLLADFIPTSESTTTLSNCLQQLEDSLDMVRISEESLMSSDSREIIMTAMSGISENLVSFTDCPDMPVTHRQLVVELFERLKLSLDTISMQSMNPDPLSSTTVNSEMSKCQRHISDMRKNLLEMAIYYASEVLKLATDDEVLHDMRRNAMLGNAVDFELAATEYSMRAESLKDAVKMIKQVVQRSALLVQADRIEASLALMHKQVLFAATTFLKNSTSKIARECLESFFEGWNSLVKDATLLVTSATNAGRESCAMKQGYMSLPRRGRHGANPRIPKPKEVELCHEDQRRLAKHGLEMKLITSEMEAETDRWRSGIGILPERAPSLFPNTLRDNLAVQNAPPMMGSVGNDIVRRAKAMSELAFSMYLFTRGEGPLRTTQDLFSQAEDFAEEANRLYRVVKDFGMRVPLGLVKTELLTNLDKVPMLVQQLLGCLKQPAVGKAATFNKVDGVIQQTKHLMNAIAKVVTTCFICSTKYNIDPILPSYQRNANFNPFPQNIQRGAPRMGYTSATLGRNYPEGGQGRNFQDPNNFIIPFGDQLNDSVRSAKSTKSDIGSMGQRGNRQLPQMGPTRKDANWQERYRNQPVTTTVVPPYQDTEMENHFPPHQSNKNMSNPEYERQRTKSTSRSPAQNGRVSRRSGDVQQMLDGQNYDDVEYYDDAQLQGETIKTESSNRRRSKSRERRQQPLDRESQRRNPNSINHSNDHNSYNQTRSSPNRTLVNQRTASSTVEDQREPYQKPDEAV